MSAPRVPAAFINAIAEEGTKAEAVEYLQKVWDEKCALERENADLRGGNRATTATPRHDALRKRILGVPISMRWDILLDEYAKLEREAADLRDQLESERRRVAFPDAAEADKLSGWTISPAFLVALKKASSDDYMPDLEGIEAVLMAIRALSEPQPALEDEAGGEDAPNPLPFVVQYRRKDCARWIPMAAFDFEGVATRYAERCGEGDMPWEYRVVDYSLPPLPKGCEW